MLLRGGEAKPKGMLQDLLNDATPKVILGKKLTQETLVVSLRLARV
jgi:hypothetical protein